MIYTCSDIIFETPGHEQFSYDLQFAALLFVLLVYR